MRSPTFIRRLERFISLTLGLILINTTPTILGKTLIIMCTGALSSYFYRRSGIASSRSCSLSVGGRTHPTLLCQHRLQKADPGLRIAPYSFYRISVSMVRRICLLQRLVVEFSLSHQDWISIGSTQRVGSGKNFCHITLIAFQDEIQADDMVSLLQATRQVRCKPANP